MKSFYVVDGEEFTYEVDEEADDPTVVVTHPIYGKKEAKLGRLPIADLADTLARKLRKEYPLR